MKTVDIQTPQNVKLEVQLASFGMRLGAFALDQLFFWIGLYALVLLLITVSSAGETIMEIVFWLLLMPFYVFYSAFFELIWAGQTPGKRLLGIRVIRFDGDKVRMDEVLSRWFMRFVDIFLTAGTLATLMIVSGKYSQRVGDILAGTIVVRDKSERSISLNHVLNLDTVDSYTPQYPRARLLSEDEALLIKQVVLRFEQRPNEGHRLAVKELVLRLQEVLEIEMEEKRETDFLRKILKDYIVLTR